MASKLDGPAAPVRPVPRRPAGVRLAGAAPRRRSRLSETVVGVVVVATCALGVVLWHRSSTTTESVLVLARPVRAGEELRADALRAEEMHVAAGIDHVATSEASRLLGRVASADLATGTLVSPSLFAGRPVIPAGTVVVAAALQPGQFATLQLRSGQAVRVIRADGEPTVVASATVYEVNSVDDSAQTRVVSLVVPETAAPAVAAAASAKALSLALTPGPSR